MLWKFRKRIVMRDSVSSWTDESPWISLLAMASSLIELIISDVCPLNLILMFFIKKSSSVLSLFVINSAKLKLKLSKNYNLALTSVFKLTSQTLEAVAIRSLKYTLLLTTLITSYLVDLSVVILKVYKNCLIPDSFSCSTNSKKIW